MRSLRPIASLSLSTATSISFIKKGLMRSASCGRKNLFAADSVVMPRRMSNKASMVLIFNLSPNSLAAFVSSDVGGT